MFVRFLFVFDLLVILFKIAFWSSAGKELSFWLSTRTILIVRVPFPSGVWVKMWNSIVSVPDHCLFVYIVKVIIGILSHAFVLPTEVFAIGQADYQPLQSCN